MKSDRKGGWYSWKPSSNSDFSIRAFRAYPLLDQTGPCRAIRDNGISVSSTPHSYFINVCAIRVQWQSKRFVQAWSMCVDMERRLIVLFYYVCHFRSGSAKDDQGAWRGGDSSAHDFPPDKWAMPNDNRQLFFSLSEQGSISRFMSPFETRKIAQPLGCLGDYLPSSSGHDLRP